MVSMFRLRMGDILPMVFLIRMYVSEKGRETVTHEYVYIYIYVTGMKMGSEMK